MILIARCRTVSARQECLFFCCLVFFVVWAFRWFSFLLFERGRVHFFAVWARARAPPKQQKQKNTPPPKQQKINTTPPLPSMGRVYVFAVWGEGGGGGGFVVFLLFGRVSCFLFCCLGGGFFFAVWAGVRVYFVCCFGGGLVFLLFGRGTGVHSLTGLPGSSSSDPTTKKTKQQKHGFLICSRSAGSCSII